MTMMMKINKMKNKINLKKMKKKIQNNNKKNKRKYLLHLKYKLNEIIYVFLFNKNNINNLLIK